MSNEVKGRVAVNFKTHVKQCLSNAKDKVTVFNEVLHIMTTVLHTVIVGVERFR
jgi:hypothetical protein